MPREDFVTAIRNDIQDAETIRSLVCSYEIRGFTAPTALVGEKDHLTMEKLNPLPRKRISIFLTPTFFKTGCWSGS